MCVISSISEDVTCGVRCFFVTRMLRGGDGHCSERRVLDGCCMYDGFMRSGSSVMGLTRSRLRVVENDLAEERLEEILKGRHVRRSMATARQRYRSFDSDPQTERERTDRGRDAICI
jgi:hypothetical protein